MTMDKEHKKYTSVEEDAQMLCEPVSSNARTLPVFSGIQMQILDSIANVKDEQEMIEIRNLIAEYFSNKALDAMDKLCDEGRLSDKVIESWQSDHMRTPYNY